MVHDVTVEDSVGIVFERLKLKGLISQSRILIHKRPSSRLIDFRTDRLRRRIRVTGDLLKLPERSIASSLLHEEGHLTRKQNSGWFFGIMMISALSVASASIWHLLSRSPISSAEWAIYFLAISFTSFSPRIFRRWLVVDETRADMDAARAMFQAYPGITLGEIAGSLDTALKAMRVKRREFAEKIFLGWMGWDIHPKDEERINAILDSTDLYPEEKTSLR